MSSKAPNGNLDPKWDLEDQPAPMISQKMMSIVSVLLILALVFGSVGSAIVFADQSQDIAILIGLAVALTLLVGWFVLRSRVGRRK